MGRILFLITFDDSGADFSKGLDALFVGGIIGIGISVFIDKSALAVDGQELMCGDDAGSFAEDIFDLRWYRCIFETRRFDRQKVGCVVFGSSEDDDSRVSHGLDIVGESLGCVANRDEFGAMNVPGFQIVDQLVDGCFVFADRMCAVGECGVAGDSTEFEDQLECLLEGDEGFGDECGFSRF